MLPTPDCVNWMLEKTWLAKGRVAVTVTPVGSRVRPVQEPVAPDDWGEALHCGSRLP